MIALEYLLLYAIIFVVICVISFSVILYIITKPYPKIWRDEKEKYFFNPKTKSTEVFPSLYDNWSIHLSVIVPAYNEEQRLPLMLDECLEYLEERLKNGCTYEIIVVSDGSTDKTVEIAHKYALKYNTIRVLNLIKNRGKGGAVRLGILSARGSAILFADADGATKFGDLEKLDNSLRSILGFDYLKKPNEVSSADAVVCGSRAHLEKDETAKRTFFRLLLMRGFHSLVWFWGVRGIKDTQCGFKLLTQHSARLIFQALHVERWAFDVEMLYIAQSLNIPITEIPVTWTEIEGSKIVPFWSWLQMGRDLFFIWYKYRIGAWKIKTSKQT
ncbi:PREDICTED: dolichyl-phosphate beta-glucosyltransferase [Dufourea novaeangliae]|uniref:Dolichyl-phosphate beta-glucosyltransferase n=1 Tax=Dufourea novaeangliae TaxID=178035 RepID=A0A154NXS1_DUFNO|nr:PREDICTED: dolichyl-phosphate beta-glucosyltransferase [Dufourea novaeangliae]KZC04417.1 Dolichyl-phosphate beta-glucosyltransferase [Dufourea novaeangliae]